METFRKSSRQAHRLVQLGLLLFLCALFVGLAIPYFAVPRIGLSVHLLGILQGTFLILVGLLWPRIRLGHVSSMLAFWLLIYGCLAAWTANMLAGIWGAGNTMLPLAAGVAHGSGFQERLIAIALRSAALSFITAVTLILWGARNLPPEN